MFDERRMRECEQLLERLRDVGDRISEEERELLWLEEAIRLTEGEISAETNTLQRIVAQIERNVAAGISCAFGNKRDCLELAIGLANAQAEQEEVIQQLRDKLRRQIAERDDFERRIADRQDEPRRVQAAKSANHCSEFPLF